MRRCAAPLVLLVLSSLLGTVPAGADPAPAPRVEIWRGGQNTDLPPGFTSRLDVCSTPPNAVGEPYYYFTQDALALSPGHEGTLALAHAVPMLDALTTYRVALRTYVPGDLTVRVEIPLAGITGSGSITDAGIDGGSEIDLLVQPELTWLDDEDELLDVATVDEFLRSRPDHDYPSALIVVGTGCRGERSGGLEIDDVVVGTASGTTVTDFRGLRRPTLNGPAEDPISYGEAVTLRTKVWNGGEAELAGAPVQLWARPSGSARERVVATLRTTADGTASTTVRPSRSTRYRWSYGSAADRPYTWSEKSVAVRVFSVVGLRVRRTARGHGVAVVRVSPAHRQRVRVREVLRGGRFGAVLGSGQVGASGVARIRLTPRKAGAQRVVAVVAGSAGVLGSHSRSLKVRLRP